ncbi:MAG: glycosyltransferase family 2 protein [Anaerolineales bacterium]|nr:glycosyltransferase family 2 protein [Anaerolineales bacterium]
MSNLDLSICIVTYKTRALLDECLASIYQNTNNIQFEIIVVDNNSQDGTLEMVRGKYPQVRLISNPHNANFARGTNQALQVSGGRYALWLNNDTVVLPGALDDLIRFMDSHPDCGICTPKVLNRDLTLQKQCRRSFATPWDLFCYFSGLATFFPTSSFFARYLMTYKDENEIHEADAVSGCCLLARREVINQIGLIDERFIVYQDDADYCFRAKRAGWKIFYYPQAQIIHLGGMGGTREHPYKHIFYWHRSYFIYYRKNLASRYFFLFNWFYYLVMLIKLLTALIVNLFRREKFAGSRKP